MRIAPLAYTTGFALLIASAAAGGAALGKAQALRIMHDRHEGMETIGKATKIINREFKAGSPNLATVLASSAQIARLSARVPSWFPPGTGPNVGKTHAKAEIWQKPDDFRAKAIDFRRAALAFNAAARGRDVNAMKAAFGNLGKACKACHDPYRAPEH